jgi:two-component system chemotaxis sensor kinase CheA
MNALLRYLVLPSEITTFEREYLRKLNRVALAFFLMHVPVFTLLAWANGTGPGLAFLLTSACVVGPVLAMRTFDNPRHVSMVFGFTAMCMGSVLVHVGQGPLQIEMHFYFFVLIALCAVFANPLVVLVSAVTVAVQHVTLWLVVPSSVFNYDASFITVAVHALFVVLESVAACFVARSFFDDVIGLERIVQRRTAELDGRNADMRLVLDNVSQGFVTVNRDGSLNAEHSAILERWFGPYAAGTTLWAYLTPSQARFGQWLQVGWEALLDDVLPTELALDQLPRRLELADGTQTFALQYQPLGEAGSFQKLLVVVSDISPQLAREKAEGEQRQTLAIFKRLMHDRAGFQEFFVEAQGLTQSVRDFFAAGRAVELKRAVHTLKGNSALFGMEQFAAICHHLETGLEDGSAGSVDPLLHEWQQVSQTIAALSGTARKVVEVPEAELASLAQQLGAGALTPAGALKVVQGWSLEPAELRLQRVAEQISSLARRLGKGQVDVRLEPNQVRLAQQRMGTFWSAFSHVVRNTVDHGLQTPDARQSAGKAGAGQVHLRTTQSEAGALLEITDDGPGIDWEAVRAAAERAHLPSQTRTDLVAALFSDGLSTRDQVTAESGRGVGLAAVRQACLALGGEVTVESERGQGTTFRFRLPPSVFEPTPLHPAV